MSVAASELHGVIREALPDAAITIEDLDGDGTHYAIGVVSERFRGVSRLCQRDIVAEALLPYLARRLRAVSLLTSVPDDARRLPVTPPRIAAGTIDFVYRSNTPIVAAICDGLRHASCMPEDGVTLY